MKLEDVKERIDNYFDSISAEELLKISNEKYGFDIIDGMSELSEIDNNEYLDFNSYISKKVEVCLVLHAERIKGKDKLLKLGIITGEHKFLTVVTNLGDKFEPFEFIGRKFPFVLNLKPSKIGGFMSYAMISCLEVDGKVELLDLNYPLGTKII